MCNPVAGIYLFSQNKQDPIRRKPVTSTNSPKAHQLFGNLYSIQLTNFRTQTYKPMSE